MDPNPDFPRPATPLGEEILVLCLDGSGLNSGASGAEPEALDASLQAQSPPRVAVDLGDVEILSSRAVQALVNLKRRVEANQGHLVLFRPRPHIRHLLCVTSLANHFPIADDHPAALDLLRSARSS